MAIEDVRPELYSLLLLLRLSIALIHFQFEAHKIETTQFGVCVLILFIVCGKEIDAYFVDKRMYVHNGH